MDDIEKFMRAHHSSLLARLDCVIAQNTADSSDVDYVQEVLDDWSTYRAGKELGEPNGKERTFWFALYELEEIGEIPAGFKRDPYVDLLFRNLACITQVLRNWGELPRGFFASRPGEGENEFEESLGVDEIV